MKKKQYTIPVIGNTAMIAILSVCGGASPHGAITENPQGGQSIGGGTAKNSPGRLIYN